jgi:hypothetical protein
MAFDFTNPYGMVTGQPNLGSITPQPQPTQTPNPMGGGKNDKLSLMLYALGGALKGDKNFVQNTMQLQQMQEGKRKQEEQNKLWEKFKTEHSIDPQVAGLGDMMNPNQRLELMMKTMGGGKTGSSKRLSVFDPKTRQPVATVLESDFEGIKQAEADGYIVAPLSGPKDMDKDETTEFERMQDAYNKIIEIPVEGRSEKDKRNIAIYENKLFGQPRVIPFYDSQGNVVESITSRDLILNPNIIKEKEKQGLFTVGQTPSTAPTGAKSVMTLVRDDYLGAKSQIDTINDLASIVEQNKDAFTLAGGLANFVNSTKYQIQSAERLANLDKLQTNKKEFTELDNMLDSKYGDILDKISQDRAVAKSIFLRLAYGTAKDIDPSGRLSDNDVKIAMDIIGSLGPNWKANLSTLESLASRTTREYSDKYKIRMNRVSDENLEEANKYQTIPQFLGGRDWRQSIPSAATQPTSNIEDILKKYPPQG